MLITLHITNTDKINNLPIKTNDTILNKAVCCLTTDHPFPQIKGVAT